MFDAGRRSLFAFSSKRMRPVSSDATFIPTIAGANSGVRNTAEMRACNSDNVLVGDAILDWAFAEIGEGAACGGCALVEVGPGPGLAKGVSVGVGVGVGEALGVAVARRSRFGVCCAGAKVSAAGVRASSKRKLISLDMLLLLIVFNFNALGNLTLLRRRRWLLRFILTNSTHQCRKSRVVSKRCPVWIVLEARAVFISQGNRAG